MFTAKPFTLFYWAALLIFLLTLLELYLMWHEPLGVSWLGAASISAFILCGFDKSAARAGGLRAPEKVLFVVALLGGSLGLLLGMNTFRHKTRKASFQFVLALIILAQLGVLKLMHFF